MACATNVSVTLLGIIDEFEAMTTDEKCYALKSRLNLHRVPPDVRAKKKKVTERIDNNDNDNNNRYKDRNKATGTTAAK